MSLAPAPAHVYVPRRDGSLVKAVEQVAAKVGRRLDPVQRDAVDVLTSAFSDGRPAALEGAIVCPRQNMKTYLLETITLARLLAPGPPRLFVWSAHEVATAQETFRTFLDMADRYPWLGKRLEGVTRSPGREGLEFAGKHRLRFRARIKTGGRGLAGDGIVLDEAFALSAEHMGSLLPILSTKRNAWVLYGSSAPLQDSAVLRKAMARGRAGQGLAYVEFSAPGSQDEPGCGRGQDCPHEPGIGGCALDDEALWRSANPATAYGRIGMTYLRSERLALEPREFMRERLGWGDPEAAGLAVSLDRWLELADEDSRPKAWPVALVVDVSPGLRSAAVVAVGRREDGLLHVEVLAHRSGVDWLTDVLADKQAATGAPVHFLSGQYPVGGVLPTLQAASIKLEPVTVSEFAAACQATQSAVDRGALRHMGSPALTSALATAARKDVGDGAWVMTRRGSLGDICPAIAMAVGVWVVTQAPEYDLMDSFG